ncbi:MAG TPA: glycosyltransferase [Saprospiraceae bacterium]|nr:glycosyltransferase [Saprospiraceae bacterium]HMP23348.1 glycosyltransferase [Saprospiraceae bacterium]
MKLSVIIVNYNVKYFLEQVLQSVRRAAARLEPEAVETWVVDNNSNDGSAAMVRAQFPEVQLIVNEQNTGFAKANNQAISASSGTYVLLLNPDTVVAEDTLAQCIAFMDAHPEAGGLGARMIDGSGRFLPESKRGFPSPWVAFCKTFGLAALFPQSRRFNHYHLGYLPEQETHEVEVLAGAFMLLRRSVLHEIGLLDEAFFMYGEDIDLSYRIMQAGYKNYYFPAATIIHYKGESTKKGSLNYVRVFYQAMIIFARKHFRGRQAGLFVLMLQFAIYFRAFITLISSILKTIRLPLWDAAVIYIGLGGLRIFWASYYYKDPGYFDTTILYFNFPLYTFIWVAAVYFSGGYDEQGRLRTLVRGLVIGTVLIAAVYGFLDMQYRSSRAIIALGAAAAIAGTVSLRILLHFIRFRNFNVGREEAKNLVIVGSNTESERAARLLQQAQKQKNLLGVIAPQADFDEALYIGYLGQLDALVRIYPVEEIIFCSKDVPYADTIHWMSRLGPVFDYKLLPENGSGIIGSASKNTAGELYTLDVHWRIATPQQQRNKRSFDLLCCLVFISTLPLQLLLIPHFTTFLRHLWQVLSGQKSWVGYAATDALPALPRLRPGVLSPLDGVPAIPLRSATVQHLNFLYARDYRTAKDIAIVWAGYRRLGKDGL